ncbi:MAG: CehA/McbA family metallohydrolase, partial [Saprospiraceae bacterium]
QLLPLFLFVFLLHTVLIAQKATVNFEILDAATQKNMPAKLVILQENEPFEHGLASTDDLACRGHTVYSRTGKGSFQLPAGAYEIWFGKGMEYNVEVQKIVLDNRQSTNLKASLKRELNPKGYIGGDMHLHTFTFSGHGDANVEERLISCVAEGLEWAVATDHNAVLDYAPYMKKLGLENYMATAVGNEVSTPIGHFNTYPLASGSERVNAKISVGKELFDTIRTAGLPNTMIQINHPRWVDSDFFNTKGLDPFYGVSKHPEWDWDFDAFEVLNENFGIGWRDAPDNKFSVKQDWFNMLNQGLRKTGLGNSDSHSVIAQIAGVPRNYIRSTSDKPTQIDNQEIVKNIKNQQVSVARGIFVNMETSAGQGIGSTVKLATEQPALILNLTVQAASWISCHKAELVENGVVIQTFDIPENTDVNRLITTVTLQPKKDSWYALIAYGNVPMAPMVQGTEKPVLPMGFTNPIWVDADSDGAITSLYDYAENLIKELTGKPAEIVNYLTKDPALIYPVFYQLFSTKNQMATSVTNQFLKHANTRQKQLLYRELSKEDSEIATNILQSQKRRALNPLEEVVLNYYTEFPLNQTKVERFKKEEASTLDEALNYLEDSYRFIYSGATEKWLKITKADEIIKGQDPNWTEAAIPKNGIFKIGQLLSEQTGNYLYIDYPLYARMDTTITFYLNTNTNVRVSRAGRILQSVSANNRFPMRAKLIKVQMKKGLNELLFRLDNKKAAQISLQEINPNKLLDANLADIKTVKHLALDKKVDYQIEYAPKYHGHGIALTDGFRGTTDYGSQLWQGWNGENAEFIIDLGKVETINRVTIGTLIHQKAWIFSPESIQCSFSTNGQTFANAKNINLDATMEQKEASTKDVLLEIDLVKARYIKIKAKKIAGLPEWHKNKGADAWIFLDEILIE